MSTMEMIGDKEESTSGRLMEMRKETMKEIGRETMKAIGKEWRDGGKVLRKRETRKTT